MGTLRKTLAVLALALSACSANNPVTSQTIGRVTVLAVRSDPASGSPGTPIHLTALVVSPVKNDPDIEITWERCALSSFEDCVKAKNLTVIGHGTSIDTNISANAAPGDVDVLWIDAKKGSHVERALKAVNVVAVGDAINHNPDLDRVVFAPTLTDPTVTSLEVNKDVPVHVIAKDSPIDYFYDSNENAAEDVRLDTFTTGGFLVDPSGTGASGEMYYTAAQAKGTYGAWIVANDGRGGIDWREFWIDVHEKASN